jgi:hypothetical protein
MAISATDPTTIVQTLETDGLAMVDGLIAPASLAAMQEAFARVLGQLNWNTSRGYQKSDLHRHMVEDILTLDPEFIALGLRPEIQEIMRAYLGPDYVLSEVRGWETLASRANFHGWHNDAWYDHGIAEVPREVKLGVYLTDVETGHFRYIKGSHVGTRHRHWNDREIAHLRDDIVDVKGPAGSTFLFDTAGIHRQSSPVLEPRQVVFFNYHDSRIPLQEIDVKAYRYHPLILNAAFLGDLTAEDQRVLGFGNRDTFQPGFQQEHQYRGLQGLFGWIFRRRLEVESMSNLFRTGRDYLARKLRRD